VRVGLERLGESCETLSQQTTLNSPNKSVLSQLKKGDILDVRVSKSGKAIIVEAVYKGQVAGTITSSIIQKLAECVDQGYEYVAEVVDIQGGACKVHVRVK
jgi:hypothetical protein